MFIHSEGDYSLGPSYPPGLIHFEGGHNLGLSYLPMFIHLEGGGGGVDFRT